MKYLVKEFDMYHECVMWFERFDIPNKEIVLRDRHGKGKRNVEHALKLALVLGGENERAVGGTLS